MDYIVVVAVLWLLVFVLVGAFKGFWKGVAACLSLFLAYWGSATLARPAAKWLSASLESFNLGETVAWIICASLLFIIITFAVRIAVLSIGKALPITYGSFNRSSGALLGAGYGAFLGIFVLWVFSLGLDAWSQKTGQHSPLADSPLIQKSRFFVAQVTAWNMKKSGASETVTGLTAAVAAEPSKVIGDIKDTFQSQEFRDVIASDKVREFIQQNDIEQLKQSDEFQALLNNEDLQALKQSLSRTGMEWTEDEIAEFTMEISQNLEAVEQNPKYQALLQDEDVQAFLRGGKELSPELMHKAQDLFEIITQAQD